MLENNGPVSDGAVIIVLKGADDCDIHENGTACTSIM